MEFVFFGGDILSKKLYGNSFELQKMLYGLGVAFILFFLCFSFTGCTFKEFVGGPGAGQQKDNKARKDDKKAEETAVEDVGFAVKMSKGTGCYDNDFKLEMAAGENGEKYDIYYTTDGSDPRTSDTRVKYKAPISVSDRSEDDNYMSAVDPALFDSANIYYDAETDSIKDIYDAPKFDEVDKITVVKAACVNKDKEYSSVTTNTYFIGDIKNHIKGIADAAEADGRAVSIMSITVDYDDFFDNEKGIYVRGKLMDDFLSESEDGLSAGTVNNGELRKAPANYRERGSEWERSAHIDYIESDGETTEVKLQQDCGIRIQGNYSRSDIQKGLRLYAREDYTPGLKNFEYPFFEDEKNIEGEVIAKYKKLVLRNGGNSAFINKYNDQFWQNLLRESYCDTQNSRPCVVYINGEYFGLHLLQVDYCGKYFEEKYNVLDDSVVSYKGDAEEYETGYCIDDGTLPAGETDDGYFLEDLLKFYKKHKNLKSDKDYEKFCQIVDPDSVRDYYAAELWGNNQWDWPGKNWFIWRATESVGMSTVTKESDVVTGATVTKNYADGRWRFAYCDMEFCGWSKDDATKNTIAEDNYMEKGMLDMGTKNVAVLMFAYLMTNDTWRTSFYDKLLSLADNEFEKERAIANLDELKGTYYPLLEQNYRRFYGKENVYQAMLNTDNSGGGGYEAIKGFIKERPKHVDEMIEWCEKILNK